MRRQLPVMMLALGSVVLCLTASGCVDRPESSRSPTSPVSPFTSSPTARPTPAEETSGPSTTSDWVTDTPDPQETPVIISEVMRTEDGVEIIKVTNISSEEQRLKDRAILDPQTMHYIDLPPDIALTNGESFRVYNGTIDPENADGLVWRQEPLLHSKGDRLVLVNQAGRVLWNYVSPRDYP